MSAILKQNTQSGAFYVEFTDCLGLDASIEWNHSSGTFVDYVHLYVKGGAAIVYPTQHINEFGVTVEAKVTFFPPANPLMPLKTVSAGTITVEA